MGLFSILRKNKQESASEDSEFVSRTAEESSAIRGRGKRRPRKQDNEPVDPALPEKKRARRRLVGAVALVMAAIIVLPMILDSEPKPLAADIAVQIPSKDSPSVRSGSARPAMPAAIGSAVSVTAGLDKDEEIVPPSVGPVSPEKDMAVPSQAPQVAGKSEAIPKATTKVEDARVQDKSAVQAAPARKTGDSERANSILEARALAKADAETAPSASKPSAYLVQVAALASQDKVNELQGKLKNAGIKSHTQKVATANGDRIRVRVGPFANREEADKMRGKISKLGLNGTLVPA